MLRYYATSRALESSAIMLALRQASDWSKGPHYEFLESTTADWVWATEIAGALNAKGPHWLSVEPFAPQSARVWEFLDDDIGKVHCRGHGAIGEALASNDVYLQTHACSTRFLTCLSFLARPFPWVPCKTKQAAAETLASCE
jgi:hypothetical protein